MDEETDKETMDERWFLERLGPQLTKFYLKEGENLIGRSLTSDIHVLSDFASRRHCIITLREDLLGLEDLGSFNGTFVNGKEIKNCSCEVSLGDIIAIGGQMDVQYVNLRKDAFLFRLRNERKEMEEDLEERATVDFNEVAPHLKVIEIDDDDDQVVKVEPEFEESERLRSVSPLELDFEIDEENKYSLGILSQMAEDMQEVHTIDKNCRQENFKEPEDDGTRAISPEVIDLISDEEDDFENNVDKWLSKLSQSQHKEVLVKTERTVDDNDDIMKSMKDVRVLLSPLKTPLMDNDQEKQIAGVAEEATFSPISSDDEIIMPKKRKISKLSSSEGSPVDVGEVPEQAEVIPDPSAEISLNNDVYMLPEVSSTDKNEVSPVKEIAVENIQIMEADQSHASKISTTTVPDSSIGHPVEPHKSSSSSRSSGRKRGRKRSKSDRHRKHHKDDKQKEKKSLEKPPEKSAPTVSASPEKAQESEKKKVTATRKFPEIIDAPVKPKRAHLRGFCASEMGKSSKKVSLETVLKQNPSKALPVTEVIRSKEIKEIRKEKLKEVTTTKINSGDCRVIVQAPTKIKITRVNRGNFLTEELPKTKIPTRRMSFDAALEKAQPIVPQRILARRKSIDVRMLETSIPEPVQSPAIVERRIAEPEIPYAFLGTHIKEKKRIAHDVNKVSKGQQVFEYCPTPPPPDDSEDAEFCYRTSDDIINEVTKWDPKWLTNKNLDIVELINVAKPLRSIRNTFMDFGSYIETMIPLMLLDLWAFLINNSFLIKQNERIFAQIIAVENKEKTSILKIALIKYNKRLPFKNGDLVQFYVRVGLRIVRFFAFVNVIENNATVLIVTFTTSNREVDNRIVGQVGEIENVATISTSLRMFDNVFSLECSPLCLAILDPNLMDCEVYKLKKAFQYCGFETLNVHQMRVLENLYEQCLSPGGTISLMQGPPGTGKSRILANLIMQLLFGSKSSLYQEMRILVCAPSNTAVDLLTHRLICLRQSMNVDDRKAIRIVRCGMDEKIGYHVRGFSMEELSSRSKRDMIEKRKDPEYVNVWKGKLRVMEKRLGEMLSYRKYSVSSDNAAEIERMQIKINEVKEYLSGSDNFTKSFVIDRVLENANVICTTLSSCNNLTKYGLDAFDVCIVDEATQANEPCTLTPLQFGVSSLVLVGDPLQLPATVLSMEAKEHGLSQSLFKRLSKTNTTPVQYLNEQYRMHPEICKFPNEYFYQNRLVTNSLAIDETFPWKPYGVFSLEYTNQNQGDSHSTSGNAVGLDFVCTLLKVMLTKAPTRTCSYGIITPYSQQRNDLADKVSSVSKDIFIGTIDAYQGQELDVIIISLAKTDGVGFLANSQRLNVALTRAKKCLFICGNFINLTRNDIWNNFTEDAKRRDLFQIVTSVSESVVLSFIMK
ncbi:probable helicase senataxin isoform X2 [Phlebotomus papatasi]|uniref:probable helicase senataxin isoform X2 n=1 Tax=Phlebotomus papatasi TaxID=29031 RepID=UPI0024838B13|nr:probable helicase senataxin isoform X2 [Phlebotomus papatasi]